MKNILRSFLATSHKRRCLMARFALRLLHILRDVEESEMCRFSDELDMLNRGSGVVSRRSYVVIEEACTECECALGFLLCAIDDLNFAY